MDAITFTHILADIVHLPKAHEYKVEDLRVVVSKHYNQFHTLERVTINGVGLKQIERRKPLGRPYYKARWTIGLHYSERGTPIVEGTTYNKCTRDKQMQQRLFILATDFLVSNGLLSPSFVTEARRLFPADAAKHDALRAAPAEQRGQSLTFFESTETAAQPYVRD
ncbi:protein of unknown function [Burkholderia multivorans]